MSFFKWKICSARKHKKIQMVNYFWSLNFVELRLGLRLRAKEDVLRKPWASSKLELELYDTGLLALKNNSFYFFSARDYRLLCPPYASMHKRMYMSECPSEVGLY